MDVHAHGDESLVSPVPNTPWYERGWTALERIANFSERVREKVPPEILDFSPSQPWYSATALASSYTSHTKFRITQIQFSGATGDRLDVKFGTRRFSLFSNGTPVCFDFPYEIDRGVDITVSDFTTPASTSWAFMIYGYPL